MVINHLFAVVELPTRGKQNPELKWYRNGLGHPWADSIENFESIEGGDEIVEIGPEETN